MKRIILICVCTIFIIYSCNTSEKKIIQKENISKLTTQFQLTGRLDDYFADKVYLNKIIEQSIYPIDSTDIIDNEFIFKGIVEYPERFALTFENYSAIVPVIIENAQFNVYLNPVLIQDPTFTGSPLNTSLNEYKNISKAIFKKIDYLFPQFQKARLENDAEKLEEIGAKMQLIEQEFVDFTYEFIKKNKTSYVAAMILRDQLKTAKIDTLRIKKTYALLSEEIKNCTDAQIIATSLNLH